MYRLVVKSFLKKTKKNDEFKFPKTLAVVKDNCFIPAWVKIGGGPERIMAISVYSPLAAVWDLGTTNGHPPIMCQIFSFADR